MAQKEFFSPDIA